MERDTEHVTSVCKWLVTVTLQLQCLTYYLLGKGWISLSTIRNLWKKRLHTHAGFHSTENRPYHVKLPDEVLLEHLPGICGMTHVFKTLRRICSCLL